MKKWIVNPSCCKNEYFPKKFRGVPLTREQIDKIVNYDYMEKHGCLIEFTEDYHISDVAKRNMVDIDNTFIPNEASETTEITFSTPKKHKKEKK